MAYATPSTIDSRKYYDGLHLAIHRDVKSLNNAINDLVAGQLKPHAFTPVMDSELERIELKFSDLLRDYAGLLDGLARNLTAASTHPKMPELKAQIEVLAQNVDRLKHFASDCRKLDYTGSVKVSPSISSRLTREEAAPNERMMREDAVRALDPRLRAAIEQAPEMKNRAQDREATAFLASTLRQGDAKSPTRSADDKLDQEH